MEVSEHTRPHIIEFENFNVVIDRFVKDVSIHGKTEMTFRISVIYIVNIFIIF